MWSFVIDTIQALFTEWLLYWLPVVGALVAAYLKGRGVNWLGPLQYGLTSGLLIFGFIVH